MRVTILTQYYPPEAGAPQRRLSDLAFRLTARGHRVQVLTALPNYPGDRVFPDYAGKGNSVEEHGDVRICRVGLYVPPARKTTLQRLRCYFSFAFSAARSGKRLLEPTDVVFMESPPLALAPAGVMLARVLGVPLVCNISDIWPQSAVELGLLRPGPVLLAAQLLERWTYANAAALTGQTEGICAHLRSMAGGKPVYFFPNGVDLTAYARPVDRDRVRERFGWRPDEFVAGYTGLLGHAQALEQLVDAGRRLDPSDGIRIVMFGDGPCREELEALLKGNAVPTVTLYPAHPPDEMPAIQDALDVGIVPLANQPIFQGARPSKMMEIMAAGRPVLLCGSGEAARLLDAALGGPAGVAVPPESPADLARAFAALAGDRGRCTAMGASGQRMVREEFDRAEIASGLEAFLLSVTARARGEYARSA